FYDVVKGQCNEHRSHEHPGCTVDAKKAIGHEEDKEGPEIEREASELWVHDAPVRTLAKFSASKTCRSSSPSPMPMKWTGRPNFAASATRIPPFAVPSSLVMIRPVSAALLLKASTCAMAFWPVVASSTSSTA